MISSFVSQRRVILRDEEGLKFIENKKSSINEEGLNMVKNKEDCWYLH